MDDPRQEEEEAADGWILQSISTLFLFLDCLDVCCWMGIERKKTSWSSSAKRVDKNSRINSRDGGG